MKIITIKSLVIILFFAQAVLAERITVELEAPLELRQEDQNGHLELVIELPKGSVISYRDDRRVNNKEYINRDGDIVLSQKGWFRSILIHTTVANLTEDEIERINSLPLYISQNVVSISKRNGYQIDEMERARLVEALIETCHGDVIKTTVIAINGKRYEVSNDNVSQLSDGSYIPLTVPEARALANNCGFRLPTEAELKAIGQYALKHQNQFAARTIFPNNHNDRIRNMNQMMNDPVMKQRSMAGKDKLIDGHFKWYSQQGKIYGFARGDGSGRFFHNSASGAHISQSDYYDYSHGVRLIRDAR